jgi:septum formation protein
LVQKQSLILASNSPRRKQILALGGWLFTVVPVEVNEDPHPEENPRQYVQRTAEDKARSAATSAPAGSIIIGSDTTVVCTAKDGREEILGKPFTPAEAREMLLRLRAASHHVYTGIAVIDRTSGSLISDICDTLVFMRPYSETEIDAYVATGDPMDKAGAYAIQDKKFAPVERLVGCYTNVVGLPLCKIADILRSLGLPPQTGITDECQPEAQKPCSVYQQVLAADGGSKPSKP